ncbi:MAG: aldo/keto reductase [Actinomycetota bacterium]|nr:aldo/keto reductase [Actinomycetota bacterium]
MKTRRLGSNGPEISIIGYGAWEASGHWGEKFDENQIIAAIHAGIEAGINWIDTAEAYGPYVSEEIVGRAVAGAKDILVATKVAPTVGGFRADQIRKAAEGSLARLGRDLIDLYQLHWPAGDVPVEESWQAMCELQADGLVRCIGVSNFNEDLIERCEKVGHVDSIQPHLSMLHRTNLDVIRFAADNGTGVVAYGPLAYGLLTGTVTKDATFDEGDWRGGARGFDLYDRFFAPGAIEKHLAVVEELRPIAERAGLSLPDLATAWVVQQSGVTSAIVGSRNPQHVRANAVGAEGLLSDDVFSDIEEVLAQTDE